jgi:hypothetical protein
MLRLHRRLSLALAAVLMTATLAPMAAEAAPLTIASTSPPPWTYGFYLGTLTGTSAGAYFSHLALLNIGAGNPNLRSPGGAQNPVDFCIAWGNPYAFSPLAGSLFLETRTPACEWELGQTSANQPQNLATVGADPSSGQVSANWLNAYGGNCAVTSGGGNPNAFIGGSTSGLLAMLYSVCTGTATFKFARDGSVSGQVFVSSYGGLTGSYAAYVASYSGKLSQAASTAGANAGALPK